MIPALRDAGDDQALRGAPLAVYVWLLHRLDVHEARPMKLIVIAHALGMKEETASSALRTLVRRGYVHRQHTGSAGYCYRLLFTRRLPEPPVRGGASVA